MLYSNTSLEFIVSPFKQGFKLLPPNRKIHNNTNHTIQSLLQLPLNIIILDCESVIININENNAITCGFDSPKSALGKTICDTYHREAAKFSIQHDMLVKKTRRRFIKQEQCQRIDQVAFHCLTAKVPCYDQNNTLMGIIGFSLPMGFKIPYEAADALDCFVKLGLIGNQQLKIAPEIAPGNLLTQREHECLKFLVNGFSAKSIGKKLHLSPRTIESYTTSIKQKLGVRTKSELIEKLI